MMWFLLAVLALIVILGSAAIIVGGRQLATKVKDTTKDDTNTTQSLSSLPQGIQLLPRSRILRTCRWDIHAPAMHLFQ